MLDVGGGLGYFAIKFRVSSRNLQVRLAEMQGAFCVSGHTKGPAPRKGLSRGKAMTEAPKIGPSAGNRGKGRKKGSLNKTTKIAKDAIATAAERLGGVDRLVEWAQEEPENERAFWVSIYPKLLPLQVNANHDLSDPMKDLLEHVASHGKRIGNG